jgi:cytochrome c oxidase subunit 2
MRSRRARLWGTILFLAALSLTGCASTPQSALEPVGPVAKIQLWLMEESLWVMSFVFAVVIAGTIYVVIRFHAGRPGEPSKVEGNSRLELIWTIIPFILLFILAVPTVETAFYLGKPPAHSDPLQVTVVGHQYWWAFEYPQQGIVTADELYIPTNRVVELSLKSADVIHAFWVPRIAGKEDVIPGRVNHLWIEANVPGRYPGQCANFCGTGHAYMRFYVVAEPPAAFNHWVYLMHHPNSTPRTALAKRGMQLFALNCQSCHTIAGTPFHGTIGPNLTNLMLRKSVASAWLPNTPANLAKWISNPPAVIPGSLMPDLHLPPDEVKAIVAYLTELR